MTTECISIANIMLSCALRRALHTIDAHNYFFDKYVNELKNKVP